jgi:WD40 repeat protein
MAKLLTLLAFVAVSILSSRPTLAQNAQTEVTGLAWSTDGTRIVLGDSSGTIRLIRLNPDDSSEASGMITTNLSTISELAWRPHSSSYIAVTGRDPRNLSSLNVVNVDSGTTIFYYTGAQSISAFHWHPDGNQIAFSTDFITDAFGNRMLEVWDVVAGLQLWRVSLGVGSLTDLNWSPDGAHIATGNIRGEVSIWNGVTGERETQFQAHPTVIASLDWSPDGVQLATSGEIFDSTVKVWDIMDSRLVHTIDEVYVSDLEWSPDADYLAIRQVAQGIVVVDTTFWMTVASYSNGAFSETLSWSPFGGQLAFPGQIESGSISTLANGAVQIVVPDPSIERLNAIAAACDAPVSLTQSLIDAAPVMADVIAQVEALPADSIPPACAADLLAVARALEEVES